VIVIVLLALLPRVTPTLFGEADRLKSDPGGGAFGVALAWFDWPEVPEALTAATLK